MDLDLVHKIAFTITCSSLFWIVIAFCFTERGDSLEHLSEGQNSFCILIGLLSGAITFVLVSFSSLDIMGYPGDDKGEIFFRIGPIVCLFGGVSTGGLGIAIYNLLGRFLQAKKLKEQDFFSNGGPGKNVPHPETEGGTSASAEPLHVEESNVIPFVRQG